MNAPTLAQHLQPVVAPRVVPQDLIDTLRQKFGDRCSTALVVREQHGRDESSFAAPPPAAASPRWRCVRYTTRSVWATPAPPTVSSRSISTACLLG